MYKYIRLTILTIILSCSSFFAQETKLSSQDNSILYYFTGKGYTDSGIKKQLVFSEMVAYATHNVSNIKLENNNIIVGKTGKYKLSLNCEESASNKQKHVVYSVRVNNKEIPNISKISTNAEERYTEMQLKKGDVLAFNIVNIQDLSNNKDLITNILTLRVY
ncbi:hypothetical protein [Chryseobacterium potabilaquae]|uniref:Uncharacterized protein n=1 Tax=Chryseobacterium potabilaquae TaxID=2675057 RepID=A0A6N4X5X8_9FLAO|nr:hypothetical protein [Chryseobacterium potabilaquae]CAA7194924.1 hypothetical protein CHRY9293_01184 [Chryseobacterium potabilaquae]